MKVVKVLIAFVCGLVIAAAAYYNHLGGFRSVELVKAELPAMEIIYSTYVGPYENMGATWEKFDSDLKQMGLEDCDAVGVYLDPPNTPPEKLRSILGCKTEGLDPEVKARVMGKYAAFAMPAADSFMAKFPYVNEFSFWLASSKVYPEMQNLIATDAITPSVAIELYGTTQKRSNILIYMPAKKTPADYQPLIDAFGV